MKDRKFGCMFGLAIGDALGAAVEFRRPGEFAPVFCYRGLGPHGLDAGEWTDDTSMALALADSISHGWDTKDQLKRYLDWFQNGTYSVNGMCFDIGTQTRHVLCEFELDESFMSDTDEASSGNGSIMRLAPVVIRYLDDHCLPHYLIESSKTTHGSAQCTSACFVLGLILKNLMNGQSKEEALQFEIPQWVKIHTLIRDVMEGSYKSSVDIKGSGWVVKSLEAALWAFYHSDSFEEAVLKAVNLGDDADTTGAITGQLAGAFYGYDAIPQKYIDGLAKKEMILKYLTPICGE